MTTINIHPYQRTMMTNPIADFIRVWWNSPELTGRIAVAVVVVAGAACLFRAIVL